MMVRLAMLLLLAVMTTVKAWALYSPEGKIEVCRGGLHRIYVKGYAYDPDNMGTYINVQVKVFTDAECQSQYGETQEMSANIYRFDLGFQNGGGSPSKGFETTIDIAQAGTYYVQVFAKDWRGIDPDTQLGLYGASNKTVCITLRDPITTPQTLTSTTGSIYIGTGCVLTGTGGDDTQVTIAEGATVTLNGATITSIYNHKWAGITCEGDATIILADGTTNSLKGGHQYYPGIYIPEGFTLTIRGNGSLDAISGSGISQYGSEQSLAAGIGGGYYGDAGVFLTCGNIVIEGGTITATGGAKAAGIGGGDRGCGNITITGGTINAIGGKNAAGIGGGSKSTCGSITISADVTSVTATAGTDAPNSIGNGTDGDCGTVSLGGAVTGCIDQNTFTFTPSQDMRSVSFDANGGTGTMAEQPFVAGLPTSLNACSFTRAGYTFIGWDTQAEGGGDTYINQQNITITTNTTLYAQWQKNPIITFNANGGEGSICVQEFVTNKLTPLNACMFTHSGYVFVKWTTNADGSGDAYTDRQRVAISADMTLYAQWGEKHTVTFEANGGSGTMAEQQFIEGIAQSLNACSFTFPEHKIFDKWSTQADGGGTSYADKQSITISSDLTLYAQWVDKPCVTFNANGGTGTMAVQYFTAGITQSLNANTFTREGYIFIGWSTNPEGGGDTYINQQDIAISSDMTLYAQWLQHTSTINLGDFIFKDIKELTLYDGDEIKNQSVSRSLKVNIADCSTVTLKSIAYYDTDNRELYITCAGDATIILKGYNQLRNMGNAGIFVPAGRTLTIVGNGSLTATGGGNAAGIGGNSSDNCGNIIIAGGTIIATGGEGAAGIGGGKGASCGYITITSGVTSVSATKGDNSNDPIGKGEGGSCGSVTVSDLLTDVTNGNTRTISGGPLLELMDNDDNGDAIALSVLGGTTFNTLKLNDRTLYRDGDWNTLCLPFNVTIAGSPLDGADVRQLSSGSLEDGTLTLNFTEKDAVTAIEAGKPYLIKWGPTPDLVIRSTAEWEIFARNVNSGTTYEDKIVKLGADIDGVSTMVGTSEHKFKGIFDGDGHTLDLALVGTAQCTAPFSYVEGATINNLRTTGFVTFSATGSNVYHASGLVGGANGVTIENCRVSMNIQFPDGTELVHSGGIIGHSGANPFTMTNCLFDGSIGYVDGGSGSMTNVGGLVGWGDNSTPNISNCLNAGNFVNPAGIAMIARGGNRGSITNCYSTTNASSNGQRYIDAGTYTTATGSDLLALLGDGWEMSGDEVVPKNNTVVLSNITDPVFANVTVTSTAPVPVTFTGGQFVGTYDSVSFNDENKSILFLGAKNTLYFPQSDASINAFRAYFQLDGITAADLPANNVKLFFGEEKTDGVEEIVNSKLSARPWSLDTSRNSKSLGAWYDLQGRQIVNNKSVNRKLSRGIYIHNGRKVVIK